MSVRLFDFRKPQEQKGRGGVFISLAKGRGVVFISRAKGRGGVFVDRATCVYRTCKASNFTFGVFHNFPERMAQSSDDLHGVLLLRREAFEIRQCEWHCRPVPEFPWGPGLRRGVHARRAPCTLVFHSWRPHTACRVQLHQPSSEINTALLTVYFLFMTLRPRVE